MQLCLQMNTKQSVAIAADVTYSDPVAGICNSERKKQCFSASFHIDRLNDVDQQNGDGY